MSSHDLVEEAWNCIASTMLRPLGCALLRHWLVGELLTYRLIDAMIDHDFEWLEDKYSSWYLQFGKRWEKLQFWLVDPGRNKPYPLRGRGLRGARTAVRSVWCHVWFARIWWSTSVGGVVVHLLLGDLFLGRHHRCPVLCTKTVRRSIMSHAHWRTVRGEIIPRQGPGRRHTGLWICLERQQDSQSINRTLVLLIRSRCGRSTMYKTC